MKLVLALILMFNIILLAGTLSDKEKKARVDKQIEKEMQREKKYAKEKTFYQAHNYDFKGAEVNPDSLDSIQAIEVDDFDMDSVYD